jgi:serine/threonine-protein kinase
MGTPAFMSPEQARGLWDEVDGRSDVWSVGATMWHALTGALVHQGRTTNEELLSAMSKPAPPILSVLPKLSPAVAQVVDRALAFEKEKRWLDARR